MDAVGYVATAQEHLRSLKNTRLAALRPPGEFFDWQRVSKPANSGEFMKRAGYNIRYFSANYAVLVGLLAVYSLITNPLLLIAMAFLVGGFLAISRYFTEPFEFQGKTITPQNMYTGLFVIGRAGSAANKPCRLGCWRAGRAGWDAGEQAVQAQLSAGRL
ncbi:ER to golgi family transport-related protein [Trichosporon asahii var. asahii CBS 2479]|uniref:PRA1 family protein n=1 Tax=Trichosporon asahii var. asahii (strain ATCC 90039 / CBS 2479 / JCM 2466 / KCTC 7840 / NBRC 103889/ NCYC 2677 / UAMH 7654) TaxID=1186058 RepID=J5R8C1_TRIAS|nr:ER to golgi family transport-related protein [Trichosporon asahii var. asahii CBS 2479]EJT51233.1 ER to golgi family transport-related protein [Trichosporon asahii var. asahii CBS 2479]